MSFVPQSYREGVEDSDDRCSGTVADTIRQGHIVTMSETGNDGLFYHAVLREITAAFLTPSSGDGELRGCVASLIDENGVDWVWRNRETVFDIIEFHGSGKKGSVSQ
jgi:hypothetical protein